MTLPSERASCESSFEQYRAGNTPDFALFRPVLATQAGTRRSGSRIIWALNVACLESGVWSLESGVWSLESGVWSLESGNLKISFQSVSD